MFKIVGEVLLDLLFPKFCCGCGKMDTYLCGKCFNEIDLINMPLQLEFEQQYISNIQAVAYYEHVMRAAIHAFKYEYVQGLGQALAHYIYYTTQLPKADVITAVPIHKDREAERGFNQAALLAEQLSQLTNSTYCNTLMRTQFTTSQASITDRQQRLKNIKNHFCIANAVATEQVKDRTVLIIDDVCTTGATLNECARVLLETGAKSVEGLVLAHGN